MSLFDLDLPAGRQWIRVGDAYEVTRKPRGLDLLSVAEIPFAAMEDIPQGGAYAPVYTARPADSIRSGTYFEQGDILVAKITPSFENGKQALVPDLADGFGYATTEVIPIRPRSGDHDRRFMFFYLLHPEVRHHVAERMEGTTGRQRVPAKVLLDLPYPLFGHADQSSIADALEMILQLKTKQEQLINSCQSLKLAAMQQLFTRGLRGEAQKETEIGPMPEGWEVVSFGAVRRRLQYGTSARSTYEVSKYPVLRIPNIVPNAVNRDDLKYGGVSDEDAAKFLLVYGDLLFIRTNGVIDRLGSCAVYEGEPPNALFASYLIRAQVNGDEIAPRFAASFFNSAFGTSAITARATPASDGKFNLNTAAIDSFPVPLPDMDEQREIVAILDTIDRKIDLHRRKRDVLDELFKALLHKLMTGEIRVGGVGLL